MSKRWLVTQAALLALGLVWLYILITLALHGQVVLWEDGRGTLTAEIFLLIAVTGLALYNLMRPLRR